MLRWSRESGRGNENRLAEARVYLVCCHVQQVNTADYLVRVNSCRRSRLPVTRLSGASTHLPDNIPLWYQTRGHRYFTVPQTP